MWAGRSLLLKPQTPNPKSQRSSKLQSSNSNGTERERVLEFGAWDFPGAWGLVLGVSSISQRQRHDSAIEKIIHFTRRRIVIAENRVGIGAVNFLVALSRNKKSGAGGENDVVGEQWAPLKTEAEIEPEIVIGVIGEKDQLSCRGVDGANIIRVHKSAELRRDVGVEPVTDDENPGVNKVGLAFGFAGAEIDR